MNNKKKESEYGYKSMPEISEPRPAINKPYTYSLDVFRQNDNPAQYPCKFHSVKMEITGEAKMQWKERSDYGEKRASFFRLTF